MQKQRVVVGMSGGVDSSVAAALLVEQGYDVTGVFIVAYNEPGCRTDQDRKDALAVATALGIPFTVLDFREAYREHVIAYFQSEYAAGRTPNPDIVCNREVKFGLFYDWALTAEYDYVATGHYARIAEITNNQTSNSKQRVFFLQQPRDLGKDQTYFLWQVAHEKLEHVLFPLGDMLKSEVREQAEELGLPNATKPDSMGVCMLGELDVAAWLKERLGEQEGKVVMRGTIGQCAPMTNKQMYTNVGMHKGLWFYTEGQRVGSGVSYDRAAMQQAGLDMANLPPLYVVAKNAAANELVIGRREACMTTSFMIQDLGFKIQEGDFETLTHEGKLRVRIRNLGELTAVAQCHYDTVTKQAHIETGEAVFAPAPGQSAVFYDQAGRVVGGGIIGEHEVGN
jgi:tRNA-specific 2-thiouridylase